MKFFFIFKNNFSIFLFLFFFYLQQYRFQRKKKRLVIGKFFLNRLQVVGILKCHAVNELEQTSG